MKYDAVAFLENLFRSPVGEGEDAGLAPGLPPAPGIGPADLPPDWHFLWDERAAIMEYDGKLPRERAEALALAEVLQAMARAGVRSKLSS